MKKYLIISCLALAVLSAWLSSKLYESGIERERLSNNQQALMSKVKLYETEAGESAASVQVLQLKYDELKQNYQVVCEEAKELGVKVKRLQSAAYSASKTEVEVKTVVKDTIIYIPSTAAIDTAKIFYWRDPPWVEVSGVLLNDSVDLNVQSVDTLIQLVHRVPKRFLFFKFGTKAIRQEIVSKNPHTKIVYSEFVMLNK